MGKFFILQIDFSFLEELKRFRFEIEIHLNNKHFLLFLSQLEFFLGLT